MCIDQRTCVLLSATYFFGNKKFLSGNIWSIGYHSLLSGFKVFWLGFFFYTMAATSTASRICHSRWSQWPIEPHPPAAAWTWWSRRRYEAQTPRCMGWPTGSSPSCLPLHLCILLGFLKNSLNSTTALVVCFLLHFLLGFSQCSVSRGMVHNNALSGANLGCFISNFYFLESRAVLTASLATCVISNRNTRAVLWYQLIHNMMITHLKRNMRTTQRKRIEPWACQGAGAWFQIYWQHVWKWGKNTEN